MKRVAICILLLTGCSNLLPTEDVNHTNYSSFDKVKENYDNIVVDKTTHSEVIEMGFDPYGKNNVTIMEYTDVITKFMPSDNIYMSDLPHGVKLCIDAKEKCFPFSIEYSMVNKERIGNVLADLFGFKKETVTTGWSFDALIIIVDDIVVYKIFTGEPNHYQYKKVFKPLGPLQSLGSAIIDKSV